MSEALKWAKSKPENKGKSRIRRHTIRGNYEDKDELRHFMNIAGTDNGYSCAKMMQENERYANHRADYIDVSDDPQWGMGFGYTRRRS
jgi:hypothetical protein